MKILITKNYFINLKELKEGGLSKMKKLTVLSLSMIMMFGAVAYADIDNMDIGGDLMLEYFYAQEFDLNDAADDETDFIRSEMHLWFQADLDDNITARISLEADRALNNDAGGGLASVNRIDQTGIGDLDVFLEEAFVKWADINASGFTLSAGRQFLNYGDNPHADDYNRWWGPGFIIADSRTNSPLLLTDLGSYEIDPFDAVVVSYETEMSRVDAMHARDVEDFYTNQGPRTGASDDATLWALYGSYFGIEGHQLDVYFTYNDEDILPGAIGFRGQKYIVGGRAAGDLTEEVAYKAEVAYQFEDREVAGVDEVDALGAQVGMNYHPNVDREPNIGVIYTFLQQDGNDNVPSGFSAPFEGKTYGLIAEGLTKTYGGPGAVNPFTNMHVINVNGGMLLTDSVAWTADFYYFLMQDDIVIGNQAEDDGGFEFDTQVDYRFNDNLTTFLGGGVFFPGDAPEAAAGGNDDEAYFVRAGVKVDF